MLFWLIVKSRCTKGFPVARWKRGSGGIPSREKSLLLWQASEDCSTKTTLARRWKESGTCFTPSQSGRLYHGEDRRGRMKKIFFFCMGVGSVIVWERMALGHLITKVTHFLSWYQFISWLLVVKYIDKCQLHKSILIYYSKARSDFSPS